METLQKPDNGSRAAAAQSEIRCDGVWANYGAANVLQDISLTLRPGVNVLLAPNGAGKTTFFRVCCGIIAPSRGSVSLLGHDPAKETAVRARVGYLAHRLAVYPDLSVENNLLYWTELRRKSRADGQRLIGEFAERLSFTELLPKLASTLSRGQLQIIAVARALMFDPACLFLDEPMVGLDPFAQQRVRTALAENSANRIVVISTHNLEEARALGDHFILMRAGQLVAKGDFATLAQTANVPVRWRLAADKDPTPIVASRSETVQRDTDGFILTLKSGVSPSDIMRDLASGGIALREFSRLDPTPFDVFAKWLGGTHV
jgi:ABC-2 type transport system ATP-binding protein